jgi:hypothetical protein
MRRGTQFFGLIVAADVIAIIIVIIDCFCLSIIFRIDGHHHGHAQ